MENILEINNLQTSFFTEDGELKAVNDVSFSIARGQSLGIVGESGSGKSITSLSILQLLHGTTGIIKGGSVMFNGQDLTKLTEKEMHSVRGNHISMIFQEPMTSLNPTITIGEQIAETIRGHRGKNRKEAWQSAIRMLERVGIPEPEKRAGQYPFQLSGGMRQRVMIAIALSCDPELLIADEPTTALDVTIQLQILALIKRLQRKHGSALMMITHDLGVIAETCDYVAVMYCGKVVEYASVHELFENPLHPYTAGLLKSIPSHTSDTEEDLYIIEGQVPSPYELPEGCHFAPRCPNRTGKCLNEVPELLPIGEGRTVRCHNALGRDRI